MMNYDDVVEIVNSMMFQIINKAAKAPKEHQLKIQTLGYPDIDENFGYFHFGPEHRNRMRNVVVDYFSQPGPLSLSGRKQAMLATLMNTAPSELYLDDQSTKQNNEFLAFLDHYTSFYLETEHHLKQSILEHTAQTMNDRDLVVEERSQPLSLPQEQPLSREKLEMKRKSIP